MVWSLFPAQNNTLGNTQRQRFFLLEQPDWILPKMGSTENTI